MALPTITFNSATGSDTTASGDNGAASLNGTAAATTAASAVVSLLTDNPDLSSVATDGSQVLWVLSSSGRQFSKITGKDNTAGIKTVTCQSTYANTEGSRTWGIGGKRATLDNTNSRKLLTADALPGWTLSFEDDSSATLSSTITGGVSGDLTTGPIFIQGSAEGRVMNMTANQNHFAWTGANNPNEWKFKNLKFTNSNATKTSAIIFNMNSCNFIFEQCVFGDATNKVQNTFARAAGGPAVQCFDCAFLYNTGDVISIGNTAIVICEGCWFDHNTGIAVQTRSDGNLVLDSCLFTNGSTDAIKFTSAGGTPSGTIIVRNCTIHGNTGDGIDSSAGIVTPNLFNVRNNNFTANGGYGWNAAAAQPAYNQGIDYNNYGTGATANTSGARNNLTAGAHDIAVDPGYVATGSNNWGVGSGVQDKGFPDATRNIGSNQSATVNYSVIGAAEPQVTGSGGGASPIGLGSPVIRAA